MRQPTSALAYPFRHVKGTWEVLLLRRVARPELGLDAFWQGVTGGVEGDETFVQAAARELREATGYAAKRLEAVDFVYSFPIDERQRRLYADGAREVTEHVYLAVIDSDAEPRISVEHDEWRWCEIETALSMLHWPKNVEALRRCVTRIG